MKINLKTLAISILALQLLSIVAADNTDKSTPDTNKEKSQKKNLHEMSTQEENGIDIINQFNINQYIMTRQRCIIIFYAPWCGHCQTMMPQFQKASQALKKMQHAVTIAQFDATTSQTISDRYKIEGYPTIKFFINGQAYDYPGEREQKKIISWVSKKAGPLLNFARSAGHLRSAIQNNERVAVLFFDESKDNSDGSLVQIYERVAWNYNEFFFFGSTPQVAKEFGIQKTPQVVLFRQFDEPVVQLGSFFSQENLNEFFENHRRPVFQKFHLGISDEIFSQEKSAIFLFTSQKTPEASQEARNEFQKSASALQGKLLVVHAPVQEDLSRRVADYLGVVTSYGPAVMIVQFQNNQLQKYSFKNDQQITQQEIVPFVDQWVVGELTPTLASQPLPENDFENGVRVVVGESFDQIVKDETKDVLIMLYAPWCEQCQSLTPILEEVAKLLKNSNPNVLIAKMDSSQNQVQNLQVNGFPTIKLYQAINKVRPVNYQGDRSEKSILQFLKSYASFNWKQPKQSDL